MIRTALPLAAALLLVVGCSSLEPAPEPAPEGGKPFRKVSQLKSRAEAGEWSEWKKTGMRRDWQVGLHAWTKPAPEGLRLLLEDDTGECMNYQVQSLQGGNGERLTVKMLAVPSSSRPGMCPYVTPDGYNGAIWELAVTDVPTTPGVMVEVELFRP